MKLSRYKITISAVGYTDHSAVITASNLLVAKNHAQHVVTEWLQENDIDEDSRGFASFKVELLKN